MASTVFETLKSIEDGRKNAIKNAKFAGLNATDNMTVYALGELFLQQNNTEFINPNDTEQTGGWVRPSDWWDTKTILANAVEKDSLFPAYILLLDNNEKTTTFTKTATNKALQGDGYLTSDGAWYTEDGSVHTWDTTKDLECLEGYKTRYVIVYVADPTNISKIVLSDFPCLEFIAGNITLLEDGLVFSSTATTSFSASTITNKKIKNIEYTENTIQPILKSACFAMYCISLKRIFMPNLKKITNNYAFYGCFSLIDVNFPVLEEVGSYAFGCCYSLVNISFPLATTFKSQTFDACHSLKTVNLPNATTFDGYAFRSCEALEEISLPKTTNIGSNGFQGCSSLKTVNLPELLSIPASLFYNCGALEELTLPKATSIGMDGIRNCDSLVSISLPSLINTTSGREFSENKSLTNISLPSLKKLSGLTFNGCYALEMVDLPSLATISGSSNFNECYNLKEFIFSSTLESVSVTTIFQRCYNLRNIILYSDWKVSGLNVTDCDLSVDCINDMLYRLADVTGETTTYTLILGTKNIAKINEEELAVGTSKGWVIS